MGRIDRRIRSQLGGISPAIEQKFIDTLTPEISCFLLGGRAWISQSIERDNRKIVVAPAPHGKKPTWGGFIPQFLGWEICQEIAALLKSNSDLVYLDKDAKLVLNAARSERRQEVIDRIIWEENKQVQWWTFAGGRINSTLKYGLECLWGWEVRADNF